MRHYTFPSIEQFRTVVKNIRDFSKNSEEQTPILKFKGYPKLHGTNASIVLDSQTGEIWSQSRNNILSLEKDNAGFCQYFETNRNFFEKLLKDKISPEYRYVAVYGEWCGASIQSGVAISQLPKMFIIFVIRKFNSDDDRTKSNWDFDPIPIENNGIVYYISNFPSWEVEIDFSQPENVQNILVKITEDVEKECPVGKFFGISGIGEGVVWHCTDKTSIRKTDLLFKVKGEKHSNSKVRKLASVDVEVIEKMNEIVDYVLTENRLKQGLTILTEMGYNIQDNKNTRVFIDWIKSDVIKEEKDTILASGLDFGKVIGQVMSKSGKWFNNSSRS